MKIALKTKDAHASQIMSPNTINDLMELENEILKTQENGHLKSSNNSNDKNGFRDQFVCISDNDGIITYSDTDDCKRGENIFNGLPLKLSEEIRRKIGDILDKFKADDSIRSFTVVNGTICLMNRKEINTPVMLKLQIIQEDKEMINSFIWHIKKICLMNVQHNEIKGFQIDDTSNSYMIAKINFILAMTSAGTIVSPPLELISIFFGNPCKISDTIKLEDLIDVPVELASIIKTYARTSRDRRHSVLTLDRMIGEKSRIFHAIYSSDTLTKDNNCKRLSIDVLNPIRNNENKYIFPILIKYKNPDAVTLSDNHTILEDSMPVFFGFELTKKLSESNHSIVYEAFKVLESSSTCGTRIIIKILKAEQEVPAEVKFYKFFCNEPNGCEFIEKPFRIDLTHMPTIFMESSCSQMDLFDFIDKNDILPDSTIKNIFLKIVKAIDYLHGHGIVHFDIKDENILIDPITLRIKLIDFGSSKFISSGDSFKDYAGTFCYAPVEVLRGFTFSGPEQDIWCLGIVLYTLCFKEPPFHSPKETFQGILRLPVERPDCCIQLIRDMLNPNVESRPNTKTVLKSKFLQ